MIVHLLTSTDFGQRVVHSLHETATEAEAAAQAIVDANPSTSPVTLDWSGPPEDTSRTAAASDLWIMEIGHYELVALP